MSVLDLIVLAIACEAIVELWKKAAPLQPLREWLLRTTPWLYSERQQTHLLNCPYCLSVYAGFAVICLYYFVDAVPVRWLLYGLAVHRASNWMHLAFSLVNDVQLDKRINRKAMR